MRFVQSLQGLDRAQQLQLLLLLKHSEVLD